MKLFQTFLQVRVIYISRGTVNLNQILTLLKTYLSEVQIGKKILHFQRWISYGGKMSVQIFFIVLVCRYN